VLARAARWPAGGHGGPAGLRAAGERDGDHGIQRRGLGDDEQPDQPRPGRMEPWLAPCRDDVSVRVAGRTDHVIIGGGAGAAVNQPQGGAG